MSDSYGFSGKGAPKPLNPTSEKQKGWAAKNEGLMEAQDRTITSLESALRAEREKTAKLESFIASDDMKDSQELIAEREKAAELESKWSQIHDSHGTPLAISAGLWEFAEAECGHTPDSARHALTTIIETIHSLRAELAGAREDMSVLMGESESLTQQLAAEKQARAEAERRLASIGQMVGQSEMQCKHPTDDDSGDCDEPEDCLFHAIIAAAKGERDAQ